MNLKVMLAELASRYASKPAIVSEGQKLSYADLDKASNRVAHALLKMGIRKGDRVAMLLNNSPEFVSTYFGAVKIGAIAVPLDPKYKLTEVAALFADCQPRVLFTEGPVIEPLLPNLPMFRSVEHVIDLSSQLGGQFLTYREIMETNPEHGVEVEPGPEDVAHIVYTAGPSLHPKGVALTHRSVGLEAIASASGFQLTEDDVVLLFALPLHHSAGLVIVLLTALSQGNTVVMLPGLSITGLWETIEREKVTVLIGVPFVFALMIREAEEQGIKNDLSSLRLCAGGGSPLSVELIRRFKERYGHTIAQFWGLTEATAHVTCQSLNGHAKYGSIGKALPGWQVIAVDESGRELPPNQHGELLVKGPIMKEYYRNPAATVAVVRDGWLSTGDIGKIDDDGDVYITGRKKDMIIIKGQNICPGDIESVLCRHPKVAEAAAIGIPDELRGEIIGAAIVLKPGETATEPEMKKVCMENLANYKIPKQFFFVKALPRTASGDVDKLRLRAELSIPPIFPGVSVLK